MTMWEVPNIPRQNGNYTRLGCTHTSLFWYEVTEIVLQKERIYCLMGALTEVVWCVSCSTEGHLEGVCHSEKWLQKQLHTYLSLVH